MGCSYCSSAGRSRPIFSALKIDMVAEISGMNACLLHFAEVKSPLLEQGRRSRSYPKVGILNSAPLRMPVGHLTVIVFSRV